MEDTEGMQFLQKVRDITKFTNYGLHNALRDMGVKISIQGLDHYDSSDARSMRLDVLAGLFKLCSRQGISEKQFLGWIGREFGA